MNIYLIVQRSLRTHGQTARFLLIFFLGLCVVHRSSTYQTQPNSITRGFPRLSGSRSQHIIRDVGRMKITFSQKLKHNFYFKSSSSSLRAGDDDDDDEGVDGTLPFSSRDTNQPINNSTDHVPQGRKRRWNKIGDDLSAAGRSGVLAYGVLNASWYTVALVVSWRRVAAPATVATTRLARSLAKFSKVLAYVYVGSQLTKVLRMGLAVVLAPTLGNGLLSWSERVFRLKEDDGNRAFWIVVSVLLASCLSVWAAVLAWDVLL